MEHSRTVLWRNLQMPGHDVALIAPTPTGWRLSGMATFLAEEGPVAVGYEVRQLHAGGQLSRGVQPNSASMRRR